ncbi:MAG: lytic transglycosylase domain-containing protein [Candidatus Hydrogenedentota bacterium]|nr:MAG: lytic transglycosylase domain-containing protein [Candidatus Hydrogenedentota bacterium]
MSATGISRVVRRIDEIRARIKTIVRAATPRPDTFAAELERAAGGVRRSEGSAEAMEDMIKGVADKHELNAALLAAVAGKESNFDPTAVSSKGAQGLMQLMPETAKMLGVKNPFDPRESLEGGAKYLKTLLERYGGDIKKALAAYNAGPGAVEKYGGVPPYRETREYVDDVLKRMHQSLVEGGPGTKER